MGVKKIVIIGPESTGKSTLSEQLARHYNTLWCPEYAREYLVAHGKIYSYGDLLTIANGQIELEEKYESLARSLPVRIFSDKPGASSSLLTTHHSLLFIDTNMYVMKVWSEYVFGKCHRYILDQIVTRKYDLYLLCNVDLPWMPDELREYPDLETRKRLYRIYHDIMINQGVPWTEISGENDDRLKKAVDAIERFILQPQ